MGATYLKCIKLSLLRLSKNLLIFPGIFALYIAFYLLSLISAPLGIAGGFIMGMGSIALLSVFYSWIFRASRDERISWRSLFEFDVGLFNALLSAAFIIFILTFPLSFMDSGHNMRLVVLAVNLVMVLVFNALPEVVYFERNDGMSSLKESATFTVNHWIEWYLPFLVVLSPWIVSIGGAGAVMILGVVAAGTPIFPPLVLIQTPFVILSGVPFLGVVVSLLVVVWYMLFRAQLYRELTSGSARATAFQSRVK